MNPTRKRLSAAGLAIVVFFAGSTSVWASEQPSQQAAEEAVAEALANVRQLDETKLSDPAHTSGVGDTALDGGTVTIPEVGSEGVTITDADGTSIGIHLPEATRADDATVLEDGTVVFLNTEVANAVIVTDHGIQMLTTITDSDAPTRYSYELDIEPGQHIEFAGGGAAVVDKNGDVLLATGSAWATDAEGRSIPTHYEIDGNTLVQVVDHTATENVTYPVVADPAWLAPWMIRCLFGIGLNGPQITAIASSGNPASLAAAFGRAAVACVTGK